MHYKNPLSLGNEITGQEGATMRKFPNDLVNRFLNNDKCHA